MTDKSYVSLEQRVCGVCGHPYDTGCLLLDKRLQQSMEHYTVTGWGMCPACQKLHDDGYVALVEVDNAPAGHESTLKQQDANRTGQIAHVRRTVADRIFNIALGDTPLVFVDKGVIAQLQAMQEKPE